MADPTRLLDDPKAASESLALLRSLGAPRPYTEAAHLRIASRVSETLANAPAATAAAKITPLKLVTISGAIATGIGAIAIVVSLSRSDPPAPPSNVRPVATSPVAAKPAAAEPPPPSPRAAAPEPTAKTPERSPRASARDDLAVEETLLEQARKAGSPQRALALLREHERRFPSGALTAERLFLSAKVQSDAGNQAAARRYAAELERKFPASSYVGRLRAILADRSGAKPP